MFGISENISVVIVNWNTRLNLNSCIESFLAEKITESNIVVIDQGSTDDSVAFVKARYPKVRTVCLKENQGYSHAVNYGLNLVGTPFIIVSNADIVLHKEAVEILLETARSDDRIGLVGSKVISAKGWPATRFSRTSLTRGVLLEIIPTVLRGTWRYFEGKRFTGKEAFDVTYVEGAFFLIRRSAFEAVGGLDEGFSFFFEDADLPMRLLKSGFRVVHEPRASVTHIGGASFSQVPLRHAAEFHKNMVLLYLRHAARRAVWLKRMLLVVLWVKRLILKPLGAIILSYGRLRSLEQRLVLCEIKMRSLVTCRDSQFEVRGNVSAQQSYFPFVSVIIPTCERESSLLTTLHGLKEQSYQRFEIIVVDQSENISSAKQREYASWGHRLKLIRLPHRNRSLAKNVGISRANGDLFLFCDDDIVPSKDLIETHVTLHRNSDIGGVSCRHTEPGLNYTQTKDICRVTFFGRMIDRYHSDVTTYVGTLTGPNMSVKREVQRKVGYFDSMLKGTSIFEEQDFSARILLLGKKILFTNQTSFSHIPQPDGNRALRDENPSQYYHDFHHNEIVYFLKNRNHFCLFFVVPFCLLRSIKQSFHYRLSLREGIHIFLGVFEGFRSYYRSLK